MNERELFIAAVQIDDAAERCAYLDKACGGDAELRKRVEVLLAAFVQAGSFLEQAAAAPATADVPPDGHSPNSAPAEGPGTVIGPYKLLQAIGEGGMGVVFLAQQTQPVQRKVALKLIKSGMDSRQVIARFEAERQALALMDHPNIARVYDAGTVGDPGEPSPVRGRVRAADDTRPLTGLGSPRPYFVMELVKGVPITKFCDERHLTPRERLELFVPVCQAVQHAHQKGIIHRDLKPSNVMVCLYDDKPVPKVIDFGIAKATGPQLTDKTLFTEVGQVVGTLEYMSPEQAELNQLDIDTRSDIYSLGVLLYELLTGTTPLERKRFQKVAFLEVLRLIREEETPRPSTRLSTVVGLPSIAANRGLEPKKLSGLMRGELDWIVMKTLDKDRNRRYETANGLAMDVQRYLHDEPVTACPPSAWYRVRKFTRRHKVGLRIAAAAALVLLVAVAGVSWALWDQATRQAETERTVNAALVTMENLRDQAGKMPRRTSEEADAILVVWQQAEAALAPALAALKTGTANDRLRQQVLAAQQQSERQRAQAQRKAKLLRNLDEARLSRSNWIEKDFDHAGAAARYATAFAAYDLEVKPGRTEELARRIRAEEVGIRDALIVALDDRSTNAAHAKTELFAKELRALAGAVDDDLWRQKYRAAANDKNAEALRALSREARQLSLPASSLVLLAWSLRDQGDHAEMLTLLRWARVRYPGDFWVHYVLAKVLEASREQSRLELEEAIGCYTTALSLRPKTSVVHNNLGLALLAKNQADARDSAIYAFKQALIIDPKSAMARNNLGLALLAKKQFDDAIAEFRKVIDLDPRYAPAHNSLGNALMAKNQLHEAIAEYRKASEVDPKYAMPHYNLGRVLQTQNQLDGAIAEYRKAIDLDPKYAPAHSNLGRVLQDDNQLDEAIAEYRQAIDLDPNLAPPHVGLGAILFNVKRDCDGAIVQFRKAIDLDPNLAPAHYNLGVVLRAKNQSDDAITQFRKVIKFDPKHAEAHNHLANLLQAKNQLNEAITEFRKAIDLGLQNAPIYNSLGAALVTKHDLDAAIDAYKKAINIDPNCAPAHFGLGNALRDKNQLDGASAEYKKAIALQPHYAEAYCNLAQVLRFQGQLSSSLGFYKSGHALGSKRKVWRYPSEQWVADAERLVQLEVKLPDVLAGKATPTDKRELLGLLEVCRLKRRYVAAARLYTDAFTADAKLADNLKDEHRYNAACYASLAAAGYGTDAGTLDDRERGRLRQQALTWLRADIAEWSKQLEGGKPEDRQVVRAKLDRWQRDTDLAGVRDADALKKLSAEEREAWRKLWADVAEVRKKAGNAR